MMLDFMEGPGRATEGRAWQSVRYEDLIERPREIVPGILRFIGADIQSFDWKQFDALPLRGSSTHRVQDGHLSWEPVPKPSTFNPIGRWRDWSGYRRWRFKRIAGEELVRMRYATGLDW